MQYSSLLRCAVIGGALFAFGCSSPSKMSTEEKSSVNAEADAALVTFRNEDPSLADLMSRAVAYAIFPDVGKAGFIAGGSKGDGTVYDNMGSVIGHADITQATVGLQAGAQTFAELVLFMKPEELAKFKNNEFEFAGNISAVAIKSGAARTADASKGVIVFVRSKGGLMAEASVGGQRFRFHGVNEPNKK